MFPFNWKYDVIFLVGVAILYILGFFLLFYVTQGALLIVGAEL